MSGVDYQLYGVAEKPAVVLEIGSRYTRCGIAGEAVPRHIIRTKFKLSAGEELHFSEFISGPTLIHHTQQQWLEGVEAFLRDIYFLYLQSSPRERRVVVCEDVLCPDVFRSALTQALFDRMQVPAVTHVYSPIVALMPLLKGTALVVDCGYNESKVLPIYEGSALTASMKCAPLGASSVHKQLGVLLSSSSNSLISVLNNSASNVQNIPDDMLEEIAAQACFIINPDELSNNKNIPDILYPHTCDTRLKVTGEIRTKACNVLFEGDDEGVSIVTLVLDALKKSPKDTRMELAHNIFLVGGTVMMGGFQGRFLREMKKQLSNPDYAELRGLSEHFDIVKPKYPANYIGWLGGAIVGTIDQYAQKITKDVYIRNGRHIPDWTRLSKLTLI